MLLRGHGPGPRTFATFLTALSLTLLAHAGDGGSSWTLRSNNRPSARRFHAMATDTHRSRIVLFGGWHGSSLGDTWEWDGAQWRKMNPPGARPIPRSMHAMAYDSHRQQTILFGGIDDDDDGLDDTWAWDGVRWTLLSTSGPDVYGHAMAYDAERRRIVLFGGFSNGDFEAVDDTWTWNGSAWHHVSNDGPLGRWLHANGL